MKHVNLGRCGIALALLMVVSIVLSSLFCSIPWAMVCKP
jgi:hypothetical protein